jgi:hypothetical protein
MAVGERDSGDDDVPIWGCKAIAKIIGRSERQTFHLLSAGLLPVTKIGATWVSTRRRLRERIAGKVVHADAPRRASVVGEHADVGNR